MGDFLPIYQNNIINELVRISTKPVMDEYGTVAISGEHIHLLFPDEWEGAWKWSPTMARVLDALLIKAAEQKSDTVFLATGDYAKMCEIIPRAARRQINEFSKLISAFSLEEINTQIGVARCLHGGIEFTFSRCLFDRFQTEYKSTVIPFPAPLFRLNMQRPPNAYNIGRRIAEHKFMNLGKSNEDTIRVKTVLQACPYLKTGGNSRNLYEKEIAPLEKSLSALSEVFKWEYTDSLPYGNRNEFYNANLKIQWNSYPEEWEFVANKRKKFTKK